MTKAGILRKNPAWTRARYCRSALASECRTGPLASETPPRTCAGCTHDLATINPEDNPIWIIRITPAPETGSGAFMIPSHGIACDSIMCLAGRKESFPHGGEPRWPTEKLRTLPEKRAEEMSCQTILLNGRSPKPPARVSLRKRR
jgi:hypothetical protein